VCVLREGTPPGLAGQTATLDDMDANTPTDPAARRRAFVRRALGRPGSWRKWLVYSAVWLTVWACIYAFTRDLVLLFVAIVANLATIPLRAIPVGDEDEVHPALDREVVRALRDGAQPPEDPALITDPADWFTHGGHRFDGVPLPPSAEDPE
jgi:hypothetical protein